MAIIEEISSSTASPVREMAKKDEEQVTDSTTVHLVGGALAGLFSDGVVHPVDTIRARMQVQRNVVGQAMQYKSATDALVKMVRVEGGSSLYRGFGAVALGTVPGHGLYFAGYEFCKAYLEPWTKSANGDGSVNKTREITVHLTSGLVADVFGSLVWTPMDVIKQRLQVQSADIATKLSTATEAASSTKYKGSADAVRTILREDGFRGLYRGFGAGLLTFGPYVAIYFALYEQLKLAVACDRRSPFYESSGQDVKNLPFYMYLSTAALAGSVSALFTCPLDVAKTRIQVQRQGSGQTYYRNAVHALRTIVKEEGIGALFQGLQPRMLWMAGGTALTMVSYEEIKKAARVMRNKSE